MKIRTAYGRVIKKTRLERGLSLKDAAKKAIISPSYLFEVEKGLKEASSEYLGSILTALDITPVEFFTRVAGEYQNLSVLPDPGLTCDVCVRDAA
jgi:transcriptional regulator with XRE-family HTH domain